MRFAFNSLRRKYVERNIVKLTTSVNIKIVSQKERGVFVVLPIETQFYRRMFGDVEPFFCSAIAERIAGKKNAPGRLERRK